MILERGEFDAKELVNFGLNFLHSTFDLSSSQFLTCR